MLQKRYKEVLMKYTEINKHHRAKARGTCSVSSHFEWQDNNFMDLLLGNLPPIKYNNVNKASQQLHQLKMQYENYCFFNTDKHNFLTTIKQLASSIQETSKDWVGINFVELESTIKMHKCCLITGEGGIGKSYFVKCFEEELEKRHIEHLCLYGKFIKDECDLNEIDFDEIVAVGTTEQFVFIFDAINEVPNSTQQFLYQKIKELLQVKGIRVVITYRSFTLSPDIVQKFQSIAGMHYTFPGISFESAIEWLYKIPIVDASEYVDILYSNNPLLLSRLPFILKDDSTKTVSKNNISRYTYIYEQFIKRSVDKAAWLNTKKIAEYMYNHNTKIISISSLCSLIPQYEKYLSQMQQSGFLDVFISKGTPYCTFSQDSFSDYLIARNMWNEIESMNQTACIDLIESKLRAFYGIQETLILLLFDKYSPDFSKIKNILIATHLIDYFSPEVLTKIHFNVNDIPAYLKIFDFACPQDALMYFAGYINTPYNCINYINKRYLSNEKCQTEELSKHLENHYSIDMLTSRLKNALYYICKCNCTDLRARETFYMALWSSAACNTKTRKLAKKLLYEILQRHTKFIDTAIEIFPKIHDYYIQDAIIHALSMCPPDNRVYEFLNKIWIQKNFLLAKSLQRMSEYLNRPYAYILITKNNLYNPLAPSISTHFINLLQYIDLMDKEVLPFRFWGVKTFQNSVRFLAVDKQKIATFNKQLCELFSCVETGECNGRLSFVDDAEKFTQESFKDRTLNGSITLASMEVVFRHIFKKYGLCFNDATSLKNTVQNFSTSLLKKCICIAIDIFYGSLMCNYYTNNFATYNNLQNSIGYEVYAPLEWGDDVNIRSPLSIYQPYPEKMGRLVLHNLQFPFDADEQWWADLTQTKDNLNALMQPIRYDNHEWVLIAGRVHMQDALCNQRWHETYDLFCCTSNKETIKNDGNERYLTIELDDYTGNLNSYIYCKHKPWLCKSVPAISYESGVFDDSILILPPAELIKHFQLQLNLEEMCWINSNDEPIIICNNNRSSYFRDSISGTVFIRKDIYDEFLKEADIKYFAYSEKYLQNKGYNDDTAYHFEIINGKITKEIQNYKKIEQQYIAPKISDECLNCKYGFYHPISFDDYSEFLKTLNISQYDG